MLDFEINLIDDDFYVYRTNVAGWKKKFKTNAEAVAYIQAFIDGFKAAQALLNHEASIR